MKRTAITIAVISAVALIGYVAFIVAANYGIDFAR